MIDIVSVKNMRDSEAQVISDSIPSLELMRRAGIVLYKSVTWKGNVDILTGKGNNGGDGFALACILANEGFSPVVYKVEDYVSDDAYYFEKQAKELGVIINDYVPHLNQLDDADIIVDCLLGTGFKGEISGYYADAIKEINDHLNAFVVSCDINSGVSGDYGPSNIYVKSDLTVSIQAIKKGMLVDSKEYLKRVTVGDIGVQLLHKEDSIALQEDFKVKGDGKVYQEHGFSYYYDGENKIYQQPEWLKVRTLSYK